MATKTVANITLKDLDRMRALAKYWPNVAVEGRVAGYSIAFTYSAGAGWYTVEIQDGQETRRIQPDKDLDGLGKGPCAEECGRPGWVTFSGRVICEPCFKAFNK
jgi:hypothetical protein